MKYISAPYASAKDKDARMKQITTHSANCLKKEHVICPMTMGHNFIKHAILPSASDWWLDWCLALLSKCDEMDVLQFNGWDTSYGVQKEIEFAKTYNIKINFIPMDEFLIPESTYNRLLEEYDKYGSLTIGYDFDGTVHDYHKTGASHELVRQLIRNLKEIGCKVICWTAYEDLGYVRQFLINHNLPFDGINEGGIPLPWESKKPFFSALLDDRAGLSEVYRELTLLVHEIKSRK